jgi:hypothetical protein
MKDMSSYPEEPPKNIYELHRVINYKEKLADTSFIK